MRPILLTRARSDNTPVYVNPARILFFERDPNGGTQIDFGYESIRVWVRESPEDIANTLGAIPPFGRRWHFLGGKP